MKWNRRWVLPAVFVGVAALTRWPGLFPPNFSAFYALAFCAGAFFRGQVAWWVPLGTLLATDLVLNCYYQYWLGYEAFQWYQLLNYAGFAVLIGLGRCFRSHRGLLPLLGGGLLGACLFYVLTNTASWLFNPFGHPEYTKDLAGWLVALTKGTAGFPPTWEFFRNTMLSGGLFTALFAWVHRWAPSPETEAARDPEPEGEEAEGTPKGRPSAKPAPAEA
ncbi:MAG: hypothetical protein KF833_00830 [Verrucomicrobiae bacterium]|nr:hypothetical protein [Verrucomicrobiae bacterium]